MLLTAFCRLGTLRALNKAQSRPWRFNQTLRIMQLTGILLLACGLSISAHTVSQTVTFTGKQVSLEKVFGAVTKQTGYFIVFNREQTKKVSRITIDARGLPLTEFMDRVLCDMPFQYHIEGKSVFIQSRKTLPGGDPAAPSILGALQPPITIRGRIVTENGEPQVASIMIKGTSRGTTSNDRGEFEIVAEPSDVLIITATNIAHVEYPINGRSELVIGVRIITSDLDDVVFKGYYSERKRLSTASVAKVSSKAIDAQPVSNIIGTLHGRMAGVDIIQDGGTPGGAFQIRIRGVNSLRQGANDPLFVIDGVPYSSQTIGAPEVTTSAASATSPLNSINPADVESIEVLKDADATAIYGSRGANGVVLITTKRGKPGKTSFSATFAKSAGKATRFPKLMHTEQYLAMRRQAYLSDGITDYPASAYDVNGVWDQTRDTDWHDELLGGTAQTNDFRASVTGGSEHTQYLLSGSYRTETSVMPGDFTYNRGGGHFNMNHQSADKKFRLSFTSSYAHQKNRQPSANLVTIARNLAPNAPALYNDKGELNWENSTFTNPLAGLRATFNNITGDLLANATLSYQLIQGLELKTSMGFTDTRSEERGLMPATIYDPAYGLGSSESILVRSQTTRQSWLIEPQLNWQLAMGRSRWEALIGSTFQQQSGSRFAQMGYGFSSDLLINSMASAFNQYLLADESQQYKYQAFFGRLNYQFDNKYVLNLTGRRDGSSRFGPGKQFALFGAVGAAWIFSEESFLQGNNLMNFGKLRLSYGSTGNDQIGDYQFYDTYQLTGSQYQGVSGLAPTRLFNPDFAWEKNRKFEVAVETGWFQDRLHMGVSWYSNRSSNQLVGIPLPGTTGFSALNANLDATVGNQGVELTLQSVNVRAKKLQWTSSFNISFSRNKLIAFPGLAGSTYVNRYVIGKSINISRLFQSTGIDPVTGAYSFTDADQSGSVSGYADRIVVRDLLPRFSGGLQNTLRYGSWELDFLFQFVSQDVNEYFSWMPGTFSNQLAALTNFWEPGKTDASYQRLSTGVNSQVSTGFNQYTQSDAAVVNGSYIRLKNISLQYHLDGLLARRWKARVFLQGQNVLTFTPYKGGDPEFRYGGFLPPMKVFTAGVQVTL